MTNRKFDDFDEFAKDYRETHDKSVQLSGADSDYFSEHKILELLKHESPQEKIKILDFGCGDGNSLVYFRKHYPNAKLYGVDLSDKSISVAKMRNLPKVEFKSFDGSKIPFADETFDIVFTSMVFHHIQFNLHAQIVKEIMRVMKPKARFYNFEHNPYNPLTRKVVRECEFDEDAVLLKPTYMKNLISVHGLTLNKLNYTLFVPRHKMFTFLLGLERILTWCPLGAQYYIKGIK